MSPPLLEVTGLSRSVPVGGFLSRSRRTLLNGVSFTLERGEIVALVGESGSGKSTLARVLARLDAPDGGSLRLGGEDVLAGEKGGASLAYRGRVQMVFQDPFASLNPVHTVAHHLERPLLRHGRATRAELQTRVHALLESVGLTPGESFARRFPHELSGGQRQRVAIGRAIVRKPRVFLFDEPLSNLDAALRVQMRIELARLHDELAATMIYVTHDQIEAMTMADKIVVLQGGIIEQAGTPLELYHHPRNLFVAGFIGSPKMNFLPAKVTGVTETGTSVQLAGGSNLTIPVRPSRQAVGDSVTLGVRPEHMRLSTEGELLSEVMVVERLGGETYLYTQLKDGTMLIVQAGGETPTGVHERIAIKLDPGTCHLFDNDGMAIERVQRHPLANLRRLPSRKAG